MSDRTYRGNFFSKNVIQTTAFRTTISQLCWRFFRTKCITVYLQYCITTKEGTRARYVGLMVSIHRNLNATYMDASDNFQFYWVLAYPIGFNLQGIFSLKRIKTEQYVSAGRKPILKLSNKKRQNLKA